MAPEVYNGHKYDARVDIYSLGMMLYRLMNGQREPFIDADKQIINYKERKEALQRRMDGEALPPPRNASRQFAKVILKACSYKPGSRYKNADEFMAALQELLTEADKNRAAAVRRKRLIVSAYVLAAGLTVGCYAYETFRPRRMSDYPNAGITEILDGRYAIFITEDQNYGVIDTMDDNKVVIKPKYKEVARGWEDQFIVRNTQGLYGVIDVHGNVILPEEYETFPIGDVDWYDDLYLQDNPMDYYLLEQDGFYGCADSDGNIIVECKYKNIWLNSWYGKEDLWVEDNIIKNNVEFYGITLYSSEDYSHVIGYYNSEAGEIKEIDLRRERFEKETGKELDYIMVSQIDTNQDLYIIEVSDNENYDYFYWDPETDLIFNRDIWDVEKDENGYTMTKSGPDGMVEKGCYIDKNGKQIIEEGPYEVEWDGHGYILTYQASDFREQSYTDEKGNIIIERGRHEIEWDGHGYLLIYYDSDILGEGYANEKGKIIIERGNHEIVWDGYGFKVNSYENGLCLSGYLDSDGNEIIKPVYEGLERLPQSGCYKAWMREDDTGDPSDRVDMEYALLDENGDKLTEYIYSTIIEEYGKIKLYRKDSSEIDIYYPKTHVFTETNVP